MFFLTTWYDLETKLSFFFKSSSSLESLPDTGEVDGGPRRERDDPVVGLVGAVRVDELAGGGVGDDRRPLRPRVRGVQEDLAGGV